MKPVLLALITLGGCTATVHYDWQSWAIQGKYSQTDCASQPGTTAYYVYADMHKFFLECRL